MTDYQKLFEKETGLPRKHDGHPLSSLACTQEFRVMYIEWLESKLRTADKDKEDVWQDGYSNGHNDGWQEAMECEHGEYDTPNG